VAMVPCTESFFLALCVSQKKPIFALGKLGNFTCTIWLQCFPCEMNEQYITVHCSDCSRCHPIAAFGLNVQHERQLVSTGRQLVSITTTPLFTSPVFARCPIASRFHFILGKLLTSLGPSLRPRRTFVPLSPNPTQPAARGSLRPRLQRRSSMIVQLQRSPRIHNPSPIVFPSLD
jgi:hypothetical protein